MMNQNITPAHRSIHSILVISNSDRHSSHTWIIFKVSIHRSSCWWDFFLLLLLIYFHCTLWISHDFGWDGIIFLPRSWYNVAFWIWDANNADISVVPEQCLQQVSPSHHPTSEKDGDAQGVGKGHSQGQGTPADDRDIPLCMMSQWTLKLGSFGLGWQPIAQGLVEHQWLVSNCVVRHLFCILFYHNRYYYFPSLSSSVKLFYVNLLFWSFCHPAGGLWVCCVMLPFKMAFCCNTRYLWSWRLLLRKTCFLCIQKMVFYPGSSCSSVSIKFYWRTSCSQLVIHWGINNLHSRVAIVVHWPQLSPRGNCLTR